MITFFYVKIALLLC